mmetsp:Transcript_19121/g.27190  ORF Transcript_19121/g.27190 Transcript_19121/m.27190 type:complete len:224 (+) Transcript_19121:175-846(+)
MGSCVSKQAPPDGSEKSFPDQSRTNSNIGGVHSSVPRISSLVMDALPVDVRSSLERLPADSFKNKYAPLNVIGTIAKSEVAASFLDHWVSSKKLASLTNREQELIILRQAVHYRSNYVWKHHVIIGSEFGITGTEIEALQQIPFKSPESFSDRDTGLIAFTDDFTMKRTVSNETWQQYSSFFKEGEIIEIILVVSHYVFFSLTNNSLCVEIEPALDDLPGLPQ